MSIPNPYPKSSTLAPMASTEFLNLKKLSPYKTTNSISPLLGEYCSIKLVSICLGIVFIKSMPYLYSLFTYSLNS